MYRFLDYFFIVFHLLVIVFNLFGWIYKPLRKWNLLMLILTGLSWSVLGIFYGFGYCPLTDWHWEILEKLGKYPSETSYTQYLFTRISGMKVSGQLADNITLITFLTALAFSVFINLRDYIIKHKSQ